MPKRDIIVIGASAGGVEALGQLVAGLPPDLAAAAFVVLHVPPFATSVLPNILSRRGPLPAVHARDGQSIEPGCIYVAPPDHHLLVKHDHVRVTQGPTEHGSRPAVDPLFRTAARSYGQRVIGVVLSGVLDDGTAGLLSVKMLGGVSVVQDPADAMYTGMPTSAIANVDIDYVLPVSKIPGVLERLVNEVVDEQQRELPDDIAHELDVAEMDMTGRHSENRPGVPSRFACPECGGALWELPEGGLLHFRCRIGHAFSEESLLAEQSAALEAALWTAVRALEEKADLGRRMVDRARNRGNVRMTYNLEEQIDEAERQAQVIRQVLMSRVARVSDEPAHPEHDG